MALFPDVNDHRNATGPPKGFPNRSTHSSRLGVLPDDRDLANLDHTAGASYLVITVLVITRFVDDLIQDARTCLSGEEIAL
jgi:hypothetical protein